MSTPRMYVLVRKDLAETYRCVQGSHALAQFALNYPEVFKEWGNSYIIFLGVRNLKELVDWSGKISANKSSLFFEPDLEMQPTALAYYGDGAIFKDLQLA